MQIKSPWDQSAVAEVEVTSPAALESAVQNSVQSFDKIMRRMPAWRRAQILYKVADQIRDNQEELARSIAREGGKPIKDARIEVKRAVITTTICGDEAQLLNGEIIPMDRAPGTERHTASTRRIPLGPVLAISAFNHPLNLACHQICTAFAAGNTVLFKPASQTPSCALQLAEFFKQAGLEPGVITVVICSGAQIADTVQDARIKFVSFIGSEAVGWGIPKQIAPGVRYALEHGGAAAAILMQDADLDQALPSIVRGAFYHAGQVCVSTQLLFVQKGLYEKVVSEIVKRVKNLAVGDPLSDNTDVGPIISRAEMERVHAAVLEAAAAGAQILCGGKPLQNNCYSPTVISGTAESMRVVKDEIFGPVLCIEPFEDLSQVTARINRSRYSFQCAMYTRDINSALCAATEIECRGFMINESTAFRVDWMPFGGSKHSGVGTGGVRYSMLDMTEEKLVVIKL